MLIYNGMKVLIVTEVYRPGVGGVQAAVDTLISGLIAHGDEVTVITGSPKGFLYGSYREVDQINGATVVRLPAIKSFVNRENNRMTILPAYAVKRYFHQYRPDIVHMLIPSTWLHTAVLRQAHKYHIPVIATGHAIALNLVMNMRWKRFARWVGQKAEQYTVKYLNRTDLVTAPTRAALDHVVGITVPTLAISNGIDVSLYPPERHYKEATLKRFNLDDRKLTIVYVGRLDGEKRVDLLIDAMKQLNRHDVQLVIVGKGINMEPLRRQASDLGSTCIFTGYVTDDEKRALLWRADVFVMASPAELQCIAALEALLCETPVVVADQVALPELLDNGKNGLSFHYPDTNDLADKLETLLQDQNLRRKIGQHARQWVIEHHSHDYTISQYRTAYQRLIRDRE